MKNIKLFITGTLLWLALFSGWAQDKVYASDNAEIRSLIEALGGGYPQKPLEMIETSFTDLDGKKYTLADFKGKVIFLNLWATWCPPCKAEMPDMDELYAKFRKKGFVMLAVAQGESKEKVEAFKRGVKYSFPMYLDPENAVSQTYGTGSIPTTYIIDKDGYIVAQFVGGREWNSDAAQKLISALLK